MKHKKAVTFMIAALLTAAIASAAKAPAKGDTILWCDLVDSSQGPAMECWPITVPNAQ